jgi:thioredoxin reductase (NADPH)
VLQEGLFLTKFVDKLVILVRGDRLKGAEVLREAILAKPNVEVRYKTTVTEVLGHDDKLSGVRVDSDGQNQEVKADGLFPFIGLLPNSAWLGGAVELDQRGFIRVDSGFCTNLPGVFAAGDVVAGSVGQLASAVGEGVTAALSIRGHLDPHQALRGNVAAPVG